MGIKIIMREVNGIVIDCLSKYKNGGGCIMKVHIFDTIFRQDFFNGHKRGFSFPENVDIENNVETYTVFPVITFTDNPTNFIVERIDDIGYRVQRTPYYTDISTIPVDYVFKEITPKEDQYKDWYLTYVEGYNIQFAENSNVFVIHKYKDVDDNFERALILIQAGGALRYEKAYDATTREWWYEAYTSDKVHVVPGSIMAEYLQRFPNIKVPMQFSKTLRDVTQFNDLRQLKTSDTVMAKQVLSNKRSFSI